MTEGDPDDERDGERHGRDDDASAEQSPDHDDGDRSGEPGADVPADSPEDSPADGTDADEGATSGEGGGETAEAPDDGDRGETAEAPDDGDRGETAEAPDDDRTDGSPDDGGESDDDAGHPGPFLDDEDRPDGVDEPATAPEDDDHAPTITGGAAAPEPDQPEPVAPGGAPDDQEMPLTEHIEEMVKRLLVVIVVMALVSAVVFPFADRLINFLWYSFLPGDPADCVDVAAAAAANATANATSSEAACPRLYHPLSLVLSRLKVASLSGFIIALPVFVYETYLFMRPGLYPNERRYYLASVPTSLVLAAVGVLFAYFLVLPLIFTYFLGYSQPVANVAFGLSETFGLILLMLGMFAAIFQIPLFLMLAIMMGVTTRRWLEDRRLYFWFGFAGVAFIFSPDPTGMAPFIVALTMVGLFEGTLLLLRWTGR